MKLQAQGLLKQARSAHSQYDAIISVAGGFSCSNVRDEDIFEKYEVQDKINF